MLASFSEWSFVNQTKLALRLKKPASAFRLCVRSKNGTVREFLWKRYVYLNDCAAQALSDECKTAARALILYNSAPSGSKAERLFLNLLNRLFSEENPQEFPSIPLMK
jgi:hypothetical protein